MPNSNMNLSDRKKKILQIVVDNYITTAQPVSSKLITEKYMPDVSSATVRGELYQLEELGFLEQPHTSAGRVPSLEAYKLYVEELMEKGKLTKNELKLIRDKFAKSSNNLEEVIENTVKIISELTNYTSVGIASHDENDKIIRVNIFRYKKRQALFLIVTENTLIRDKFIDIPEGITDEELSNIDKTINSIFTGKSFKEIIELEPIIKKEFESYRDVFVNIMDILENYVDKEKDAVLLEGEDKILNQQEFSSDLNKIKDFISTVRSKDNIISLLGDNDKGIEINIKIGDNDGAIPKDCSLVSATYSIDGFNLGTYGVIGPSRMDYKKVFAVLETVGKILEDIIDNGEENE